MQQNAHHVRVYERKDGEWKYSVVEGLSGLVQLPQLDTASPMTAVYDDVPIAPLPFRR